VTTLYNIIKRAMALMKAHVQYSQNLAVEFSHLIKDCEELQQSKNQTRMQENQLKMN
jgi:hypothetical protein